MTNHKADVVDFQRPAGTAEGTAYNGICMRLWDRLLQERSADLERHSQYAQEDGAEGAALRADAIIIMGEDVPAPAQTTAACRATSVSYAVPRRPKTSSLSSTAARTSTAADLRGMQIINTAFGGALEQHIDGAVAPARTSRATASFATACASRPTATLRRARLRLTDSELIISSAHHQRVSHASPRPSSRRLQRRNDRSHRGRSILVIEECSGEDPTFPATFSGPRPGRAPRGGEGLDEHDHLPRPISTPRFATMGARRRLRDATRCGR